MPTSHNVAPCGPQEVQKEPFITIKSRLFRDADFRRLSATAKLVFIAVKTVLPAAQIAYQPGLPMTLAGMLDIPMQAADEALNELQQVGWLRWDRCVIWVIAGLRHDLGFKNTNINLAKGVLRDLGGIPDCDIKREFIAHYAPFLGISVSRSTPSSTTPSTSGVDPVSWTLHSLREEVHDGKGKAPVSGGVQTADGGVGSSRKNTRRIVAGI